MKRALCRKALSKWVLPWSLAAACALVGCGGGSSPTAPGGFAVESGNGAPDGAAATGQEVEGARPITLYEGADRSERLAAGAAREEGAVMLYGSNNIKDLEAFQKAFGEQTGQRLEFWRGGGDAVLQRVVNEAQAGKLGADVIQANGEVLVTLAKERVFQPFHSPHLADFPGSLNPDGVWAPAYLNYFAVAWNTNLVSADEAPQTYQDLLDPKWKGKIGVVSDPDITWFTTLARALASGNEEKGLEYFRMLGENQLTSRKGDTLLIEVMVAGEIPVAFMVNSFQAERSKREGAPIDWRYLDPTVARQGGIGLSASTPRPHRAMQFIDWFLSASGGQRVYREQGRVPANSKVAPELEVLTPKGVEILGADLEPIVEETQRWEDLYRSLLLHQ